MTETEKWRQETVGGAGRPGEITYESMKVSPRKSSG